MRVELTSPLFSEAMTSKLKQLETTLRATLGERIVDLNANVGELTLDVAPAHYRDTCLSLRDAADLHFEQLIDLCGVDYAQYGNTPRDEEGRFMVVLHLLSLQHNWRLRVRVRCSKAARRHRQHLRQPRLAQGKKAASSCKSARLPM